MLEELKKERNELKKRVTKLENSLKLEKKILKSLKKKEEKLKKLKTKSSTKRGVKKYDITPKEIFYKVFEGKNNFMTPVVEKYHIKENKSKTHYLAIELSSGEFISKPLYGITCLLYCKESKQVFRISDMSNSFSTKDEAEKYIVKIQKDFYTDEVKLT